ncbi:MAG: LysR family transcriptional regulator [Eubacteriales bacterium]
MNLEYLHTFYTTVNENSISKAAKTLHMSQPSVSIQLQTIEKELGFKLLIRSNKGVVLTDAGKIVFDYATTILSIEHDIKQDLNSLQTHIEEIIVSSCTDIGTYSLPCSIYLFKHRFPTVNIHLDVCNSDTVINKLENKYSNVGIIQELPSNTNIETTKITSNNFLLICSNKICRFEKISLNRLTEIPLIIRENGSGNRKCLVNNLQRLGMSLESMNIILELSSSEGIKSAVSNGKGYAFLPEIAVSHELKSNILKKIDLEKTSFISHYYLAHLKNTCLKEVDKKFIDFINSNKRGFCV